MKILLLGYGKMGKAIEEIALQNGHQIIAKIDSSEQLSSINTINWSEIEVAIEFTEPKSAVSNIKFCFSKNIPVISGTTGWLTEWEEVVNECNEKKGAFLYASNFSLGVNIFFHLNKYLSFLMKKFSDTYRSSIIETHHTEKKDAPSGTAITLAKGIIDETPGIIDWQLTLPKTATLKNKVPITSIRKDLFPGTHEVLYKGELDEIEIKHVAHSRAGFAQGALLAAEWIVGKQGVFSMDDLLELNMPANKIGIKV